MLRYGWIVGLLLAASAPAQTVEWTFKLDGIPQAPTLFPNAGQPTGVLAVGEKRMSLVNGKGEEQWAASFEQRIAAPVTVADIDNDGAAEVIVPLSEAKVACVDAAGHTRWTRSFTAGNPNLGMVTAADLHPAPGLELVVGRQDGWLYCLSAQGDILWRFFGDKYRVGIPSAGDADGDGYAELVYGTDNGDVYCLSGLGEVKWLYHEQAPYGRSGVNMTDLDGDGKAEVLLTRSNQGSATCLMALDGVTGAFKWRTTDFMQSYVSNVTADLDGDGKLETLHADKGNWLYCTNAGGTERWRLELAGRGIFWAPAVGDVNGDGTMEIVVPVRGTDPVTGASYFLVSAEGKMLAPIKLGTAGNAGPAIGDLDGDGNLEVFVATEGPNALHALTWGGHGKVLWPSLRGDSAMNARGNLPAGKPGASAMAKAPALTLRQEDVYCGGNTLHAAWDQPTPEQACAEVAVRWDDGRAEITVFPLPQGIRESDIPWEMPGTRPAEISVRVLAPGINEPIALAQRNVAPKAADFCGYETAETACARAVAAAASADTSGIETRLVALDAVRRSVTRLAEGVHDDTDLAARATALRKQAKELIAAANALAAFWAKKNSGSFVYAQDLNPWDTFDPRAMPESIESNPGITVTAFGDEFEDVALNLLNISGHRFDVRCVFSKPKLSGAPPDPEPELARHISLRRAMLIPSYHSGMIPDALPELDRSRCIGLSPFETEQLWLVVDTHGLEPGKHALTLYLGSIEEKMTLREVPITINVSPVRLPEGVYAQMNWVSSTPADTSDQQLKDMLDHGMSVVYGPALPTLNLDAEGNLAAPIDWTATDSGLARLPGYVQILYFSPPTVKWPEGAKVDAEGPLADKGFATAIHELTKHLAEKGFSYDRWAFYPMDEPWLTGLGNIPGLRKFCQRVKAADPQARIYADPTGLIRVEYLQEFKDLIDIWQPEVNILKRDPKVREWFQQNAKTLWAYEATDPAKDLLPLGYYRGYGWIAWYLHLKGAGFWCYKAFDDWYPLESSHWSVVYPTNREVTPSRRWEACRDGQEDYRLFCALREAIQQARNRNHVQEADEAQALLDKAVEDVIAWQVRGIDEITRQTRDYELDYGKLVGYRAKIGDAIMGLGALDNK